VIAVDVAAGSTKRDIVRRFILSSCVARQTCNPDTLAPWRARRGARAEEERVIGKARSLAPVRRATPEAMSTAKAGRGRPLRHLVHGTAMIRWVAIACAGAATLAGCQSAHRSDSPSLPSGAASSEAARPARLVLEPAAPGPVAALVREALTRVASERRKVLVYVGATWCEPCQRFHHAAEQGQLDATFPDLTLLVFDADRDRDRLAQAGYTSVYIPAFTLPNVDGTSSGQHIEGSVKGDGAVADLTPRLAELLSR
jgi:hypothetical protein